MAGRHARPGAQVSRRRFPALLVAASVLGLWFGLRAPDVSPVTPQQPTVQVQVSDDAVEQDGPRRDDRR